jgi:beta-lactamase regulating signal transducer with metallopeptidase domain
MIPVLHLQAIAETALTGILICFAGGIPAALFAWILLRAFGRQNSSTRFMVLFSTLLAILLLPLLAHLKASAVGSLPAHSQSLITIPSAWAEIIFGLWGLLATFALVRVAVGFVNLQRLRKSCRDVDVTSLSPILQDTLRDSDAARGARICVSDEVRVPTAIGFARPLVILPAWALAELSAPELRSVLLHEFAHLRRWDDWTNLVQKLVQSVLFFHPAVWWIENRLSLEREMACDDIVLAHNENPRAYAQCLLSIAEKSLTRRGLSLAQAAVTRMQQTSRRISQILDGKRPKTTRVWKPAALLFASFSMLGFAVAPRVPQLVSFRNEIAPVKLAENSEHVAKPQTASIQLAKLNPPTSDTVAHAALLKSQTRAALRQTKSEAQESLGAALIPARFPQLAGAGPAKQCMKIERSRRTPVSQTVFVVTRTQRQEDGFAVDSWTVHVWQVTYFQIYNANQNGIPAKKT